MRSTKCAAGSSLNVEAVSTRGTMSVLLCFLKCKRTFDTSVSRSMDECDEELNKGENHVQKLLVSIVEDRKQEGRKEGGREAGRKEREDGLDS